MDELDLFFEVMGDDFQHENLQFSLVNLITQYILVSLILVYHLTERSILFILVNLGCVSLN